jgi:hypothetical protein
MSMLDEKEERIRAEAYRRWELEGRPHGEHDRHWLEAARIVEDDGSVMNGDVTRAPKEKAAKLKVDKTETAKPKAAKSVAAKAATEAVVTETPKRDRTKKAPSA